MQKYGRNRFSESRCLAINGSYLGNCQPCLIDIIISLIKKTNTNSSAFIAMPSSEYDFLIIGQGLAGSILAHQLSQKGLIVAVMDNNNVGSSSMVAAGIINPVTGHRLNITQGFEIYYPVAKRYYQNLETESDQPCFKVVEQSRLIKNAGQYEYLKLRLKQDAYQGLLTKLTEHEFSAKKYGAIKVDKTAVVDAKAVLETIKAYFQIRRSHFRRKLDYSSILPNAAGFQIGEIQTRHLVFCEGHQAIDNPWLSELPFKLSKGEILTVNARPATSDRFLNWGNWLVPSEKQYKLGSNFIWNDLSLTPTMAGKGRLLGSLREYTGIECKVLAREVGIRPTTTNRKPFIGELSNLKNSFCFNGFGSKGCLLIPFYAELLCQHLLQRKALPGELTEWL